MSVGKGIAGVATVSVVGVLGFQLMRGPDSIQGQVWESMQSTPTAEVITVDDPVTLGTDMEVGQEIRHHTVEDVGIALGSALREALGDARGIRRYGTQVVPMADAKVEVSVDVSNRACLVYQVELSNDRVGGFDVSLVEDFLYAFAHNGGLDLHVECRYGRSPHHVVEAVFKGLARALRTALEIDPRVDGLPSVKGAL